MASNDTTHPAQSASSDESADKVAAPRPLGFARFRSSAGVAPAPSAAPTPSSTSGPQTQASTPASPAPGSSSGATASAQPSQAALLTAQPVVSVPKTETAPAAAPAPRRGFAALEARLLAEDAQADASKPAASGIKSTSALMSTTDKTNKALESIEFNKAIQAAKKVKGALDMAKFGLHTEAQWLLFSPGRYDDYANITDHFRNLSQGNLAVVRGRILKKTLYDSYKNVTESPRDAVRLSVLLKDKNGETINVTAFGKPGYAWKQHNKGDEVVLRCKPQRSFFGDGLELSAPEIVEKDLLGKVVPIYPPIKVTKGEKFRVEVDRNLGLMDIAAQIIEEDSGWNDRSAPVDMKELSGFNSGLDLLKSLHRPKDMRTGEKAMRAAKLISSYTLVRKTAERAKQIKVNPKSIINIDARVVEDLKMRLPYPLTNDQDKAVDGICASLRSPKPMDGLLSGDVGTGKTLAFLLPMVSAHKAGKRCFLLTPNLLLISQVEKELRKFFPDVPVATVRGKKGKKGGVEGDDPLASIVIGSTALIGAMEKGLIGPKPDFLVIDEQHKFSVEQREFLCDTHTNKLEATATPIPRTAALATHGAHDLFLLRDVPVKKSIHSEIFTKDEGKKAGQLVIEALKRGEQAAVIYPLVTTSSDEEGKPKEDPKKAVSNAAQNWSRYVPMDQIAVLHGKLKDEEKNEILDAFRRGEKRLLLSSIVIEVGVTLPELKTLMVTDADRFGVVTLHQLRGRLARLGGNGHFIMFTQNEDPEAMERLKLVADNFDGFDLAEKDAEVRGYGDILSIDGGSQSGVTRALFQGVKIGPRDISFAANLFEKALSLGDAEAHNDVVRKGQTMRLV